MIERLPDKKDLPANLWELMPDFCDKMNEIIDAMNAYPDSPSGPYYCPQCGWVSKKQFEDLSMADTPEETYYKIEKLYNAMREKIND